MNLQIETTAWTTTKGDWLVVGIPETLEISGPLKALDEALDGQITRLKDKKDLTGKLAELLPIRDVPGLAAERLLLVGLGDPQKLDAVTLYKAMITAARHVSVKENQRVAVTVPSPRPSQS